MSAEKLKRLRSILKDMQSVLVAYSGGTDSTFLLKTAADVLGRRALGVIAKSETYPSAEYKQAVRLAKRLGLRVLTLDTQELSDPRFASNPPERCYFCKGELFSKLKALAEENGLNHVADGTNVDDAADFRPGRKAAIEFGIRSPLKEAGLTKSDIRTYSKTTGLPTWNKPAQACLASRFPYGTAIDAEGLKKVEAAEAFLRRLGLAQLRVRHHGRTARIEVPAGLLKRLVSDPVRGRIVRKLKKLGYAYVTLDLEGYRTGSLNEVL